MGQNITANESKIRLIAFFVLVLIIIYGGTGIGLIPVFLVVDFALRAFDKNTYSPLNYLAGQTATALRLKVKPVYMPPKRFAARMGFVFCLAITVLHYAAQPATALVLSAIIALFAALESLAGFCAGCYIYNAWARLRHR